MNTSCCCFCCLCWNYIRNICKISKANRATLKLTRFREFNHQKLVTNIIKYLRLHHNYLQIYKQIHALTPSLNKLTFRWMSFLMFNFSNVQSYFKISNICSLKYLYILRKKSSSQLNLVEMLFLFSRDNIILILEGSSFFCLFCEKAFSFYLQDTFYFQIDQLQFIYGGQLFPDDDKIKSKQEASGVQNKK